MNQSGMAKTIAYAAGIGVAASLFVLILGAWAFGLTLERWNEWQGRLVGVAGTVVGVLGAMMGSRLAHRASVRQVR